MVMGFSYSPRPHRDYPPERGIGGGRYHDIFDTGGLLAEGY